MGGGYRAKRIRSIPIGCFKKAASIQVYNSIVICVHVLATIQFFKKNAFVFTVKYNNLIITPLMYLNLGIKLL